MFEEKIPNRKNKKILKKLERLLTGTFGQYSNLVIAQLSYILNESDAVSTLAFWGKRNLKDNKLGKVAKILTLLPDLKQVIIRECEMTNVSELKILVNLTGLLLDDNKLVDLSGINELTNLIDLDLSRNELTDISLLKGLTNLTRLDLRNNRINEVPEWITHMGMKIYCDSDYHKKGINLGGNRLVTPPLVIVKRGREAMQRYFSTTTF